MHRTLVKMALAEKKKYWSDVLDNSVVQEVKVHFWYFTLS